MQQWPVDMLNHNGVPCCCWFFFVLRSSFLSDSRRSDEGLDLCSACDAVTGVGSIDGAQIIGAASSCQAATGYGGDQLSRSGFDLSRKIPFPTKADSSTSKLSIWNIPISGANSEIEKELKGFGVCLGSPFKEASYRDAEGRLTRFKIWRRYVYIDLPNVALLKRMKIGPIFEGFFMLQRARGRKV